MSNVRDFGAVGDGRHDDAVAVQHALEMGDGELEFPRGDYLFQRTIQVDLAKFGRTAIHGSGGVAKIVMDAPGPAFELRGTHQRTADPSHFRPEQWSRERMPVVKEIEIEGRHPQADGIRIVGVMMPTLTGVLIRRCRHGVHVTDRARNLLISHCHIYHNTGVGIFLDRVNLHQCNIIGSHVSYNRLGGVRIENSEIRNLQITGNDIEYNNNRAFQTPDADNVPTAEVYIDCGESGTVREGTIASNTLQATYSPNGANIRIIGSPTTDRQKAGMWTITGNVIGSQAINVHLTDTRGVTLDGNYIYSGHHRNLVLERCHGIVVGPNCFGHNPDYQDQELCTGIRLEDCESCTFTGVQIQDALAGRHTVKDAVPIHRDALIEILRCSRLNFTGLQVLDGAPVAMLLVDCRDTVITGTSLFDTRSTPLMEHAIKWIGDGGGNLVANCRGNRPVVLPDHVAGHGNVFSA
jgi:hypothetical protein